MTSPDPVDLRLLALLAESGRAAVHEMAARLGMDPREVATRLVSLSATGLPLLVGVECDQARLQGMLAQHYQRPTQYPGQPPYPGQPQYPGQYLGQPQYPGEAAPPFPGQPQQQAPGPPQPPPLGYPPAPGTPTGPYAAPGPPSGATPQQSALQQPAPQAPARQQPGPAGQDPMNTWGPPQSASWARGDQQPQQPQHPQQPAPQAPAAGRVGDTLRTTGLGGEPISVRLVEVVDPADSLFTAAGYTLGDSERAVVVHTELTNHGTQPYTTPPDLYLVLHTAEGDSIGKAPISLTSRPPHTTGVDPGATVGGHAVYVINERTRLLEVRWLARPDTAEHAVAWEL